MSGTNVSIDVDGRPMPSYVVRPQADGPRSAVIVLQEIFGVNAEIRRIADLVGQSGYVALAPNFFHRTDPALDAPYSAEGRDIGIKAAAAATTASLVRDLEAARDWLRAQPFVIPDRIGAWGFCMGASVAFVAATLPGIACAVCFYGAQIAGPWRSGEAGALERAGEVTAPLLLVFGGRDASIGPAAIARIDETLRRLGKRFELHMYPDADHGFFRHGGGDRDTPDVLDAWHRVLTVLTAELG